MPELDDIALLKQFAETDSEPAFAEIVSRHLNLVYSTALRATGDAHAAQEISQAVFIVLARKAKSLGAKTVLSGWLHRTTRLTAANYLRGEIRRQKREQETFMQSTLNETSDETWRQIAPVLDDAISRLGAKDRDAIVLRFFENKSLGEVGAALGASEDAAKMRVNRALEKLRKFFTKRGVTFSAAAIAGAVSANSVQAAPVGLAKTISAVAITKGAAAGGSTLALVEGELKIMAWTKMKTAVVVSVFAILATTSTTVIGIKMARAHRAPPDTTALSPVEMNLLADIQSDGTMLFQCVVDETNSTSRMASADSINDAHAISRVTDESGRPMKFSKRPGGGFYIFLNKPVPPGGKVSYTIEGTEATGLIQSKGSGQYGVDITGNLGNVAAAHLVQVWRLPAGATLLGKDRGIDETTNDGRIELRIDRMLPPNGRYPLDFRYRLPSNAH